ncbi:MAG: hypothetical protein ACR2F6_16345 [Mycobacteriales bacterium]
MDTNGRILAAARDGMTQRELAEQGNVATDSQLALLEAFGLLDRDGDRYRTAFALVGPEILSTLRPRWRAAGARLAVVDVRGGTWNLAGADGVPAIPVLRADDEIWRWCRAVGESTAGVISEQADEWAESLGVDAKTAVVVIGHELIWDTLEMLVNADLIAGPERPEDRLLVTHEE